MTEKHIGNGIGVYFTSLIEVTLSYYIDFGLYISIILFYMIIYFDIKEN